MVREIHSYFHIINSHPSVEMIFKTPSPALHGCSRCHGKNMQRQCQKTEPAASLQRIRPEMPCVNCDWRM